MWYVFIIKECRKEKGKIVGKIRVWKKNNEISSYTRAFDCLLLFFFSKLQPLVQPVFQFLGLSRTFHRKYFCGSRLVCPMYLLGRGSAVSKTIQPNGK